MEKEIDNLEFFVRSLLGQDMSKPWEEGWDLGGSIIKHNRFDMSFATYTTLESDPVLGPFSKYYTTSQEEVLVICFYKGGYSVHRISGGDSHSLVVEFNSGRGTVGIIKDLLENHFPNFKLPQEYVRDFKLNNLLK